MELIAFVDLSITCSDNGMFPSLSGKRFLSVIKLAISS